ncbi:MAG: hypothetical protein KKD44_28175, partial [Proteobacteria bacterium]|nr:hypothetical protein [Pseudomonadota bacterium]
NKDKILEGSIGPHLEIALDKVIDRLDRMTSQIWVINMCVRDGTEKCLEPENNTPDNECLFFRCPQAESLLK